MENEKGGVKRKKKKQYYTRASAKKQKPGTRLVLEPGIKGFLLTVNNREREAVREAYNILNEHADELFGPEQDTTRAEPAEGVADSDQEAESDEDISAALEKEIAAMSTEPADRRFQVVESGASNCVFIRTKLGRPDLLQYDIMNKLHESRRSKSRYILRMLPVIDTCRTDGAKIDKMVSDILPLYFGTGKKHTYSILSKSRNNTNFKTTQLRQIVIRRIEELNPMHSFTHHSPDYVIDINVIKTICCISIMKDFYKFKKYNMQEVCKPESTPKTKNKTESKSESAPKTKNKTESESEMAPESKNVAQSMSEGDKQACDDDFALFGTEDKDYRTPMAGSSVPGASGSAETDPGDVVSQGDQDYRIPLMLHSAQTASGLFVNEPPQVESAINNPGMSAAHTLSHADKDYRIPMVTHSTGKSIASALIELSATKAANHQAQSATNKPSVSMMSDIASTEDQDYRIPQMVGSVGNPNAFIINEPVGAKTTELHTKYDANKPDTPCNEDKDYRIPHDAPSAAKTTGSMDKEPEETKVINIPTETETSKPTTTAAVSDAPSCEDRVYTIPVVGRNVRKIGGKDWPEAKVSDDGSENKVYKIPVVAGRSVVEELPAITKPTAPLAQNTKPTVSEAKST